MVSVLDFDIQSRGVKSLVEDWKRDHDALQGNVWPLEDVIQNINAAMDAALYFYNEYRLGRLTELADLPFSYLVESYRLLISAAETAVEEAEKVEGKYKSGVAGLAELRRHIPALAKIVEEDDLASDTAFGSLDDDASLDANGA